MPVCEECLENKPSARYCQICGKVVCPPCRTSLLREMKRDLDQTGFR